MAPHSRPCIQLFNSYSRRFHASSTIKDTAHKHKARTSLLTSNPKSPLKGPESKTTPKTGLGAKNSPVHAPLKVINAGTSSGVPGSGRGIKASMRLNQVKAAAAAQGLDPNMSLSERQMAQQRQAKEDADKTSKHMSNMSIQAAGVDLWSRTNQIPTQDLKIPTETWMLKRLWVDRADIIKSAASVAAMVQFGAFPPVGSSYNVSPSTSERLSSDIPKYFSPWRHARKLFQYDSINDKAWIAGTRDIAKVLYLDMMKALATGDKALLRRITTGSQQDGIMNILAKRDPSANWQWKLYKWNAPVQVVSLRAAQAYTAREEPPHGANRLLIQALVKYDTNQSLRVSSAGGKLSPLPAHQGKEKRVLEYYVIQKVGWDFSPWTIRERLYVP